MTISSKARFFVKCTVGSGKKGTLLIRKSNKSLRMCRSANIAAANAAKKKKAVEILNLNESHTSALTPQSAYSTSVSTAWNDKSHYRKSGSSFDSFMNG